MKKLALILLLSFSVSSEGAEVGEVWEYCNLDPTDSDPCHRRLILAIEEGIITYKETDDYIERETLAIWWDEYSKKVGNVWNEFVELLSD